MVFISTNPSTSTAYHPCLTSSCTLTTVEWKPVLNRDLHLDILNLFLFRPGRSWNRCLFAMAGTLFPTTLWFSIWNARAAFTAPLTCTVRPVDGAARTGMRGCWGRMSGEAKDVVMEAPMRSAMEDLVAS